MPIKVHETLRRIRREKELTQQNVADEVGIDMTTYHRYEKDSSTMPLSVLEKIAELFKMSVIDILTYGEENPNQVKEPDLYYQDKLKAKEDLISELRGRIEDMKKYQELLEEKVKMKN